jgi:hypothetical protein
MLGNIDFKDMTQEERETAIRAKMRFYQVDPLGAAAWIEDHVCTNILDFKLGVERWVPMGELNNMLDPHPITGRTYHDMWKWQKENFIIPSTARDEYGILKHHTAVNCQPRGEGKSYQTCLLILWRFFCLPAQTIILGANSKDQSKFALYDILTKLILNSPKLLGILGYENILEKEIRLKNMRGDIASRIIAVSAFSGIYSNITAYAFSELFDMTNPKFFYQLDSSRRNIPNSQGYIDSTVSEKGHVLHVLYEASPLVKNTDPGIHFCYRFSERAVESDYLHPCNTQKQLDSFRTKFTPAEFARYFKNTWTLNDTALFKPAMIMAARYIGYNGVLGLQANILKNCQMIVKLQDQQETNLIDNRSQIELLESEMTPLPYSLEEDFQPRSITISELSYLGDLYDTNWAIGAGLDLADPLKDEITRGAQSFITFTVKGLPGSRSQPDLHLTLEGKARYIYFLVHLVHLQSNESAEAQEVLESFSYEFGSIQTLCSERWGASALKSYCEENNIQVELISPTYEKQRTGFNEFYRLVQVGLLKIPRTVVPGKETEDVFEEEMLAFRHDVHKKWYGSLTKNTKDGVQDDSMFAECWGIYGLREITPDQFGTQNVDIFMGTITQNKDLIGDYK